MSAVYNPESDTIERIERLTIEARDLHRKVEHARTEGDKRALNRLLKEIRDEIAYLDARLSS